MQKLNKWSLILTNCSINWIAINLSWKHPICLQRHSASRQGGPRVKNASWCLSPKRKPFRHSYSLWEAGMSWHDASRLKVPRRVSSAFISHSMRNSHIMWAGSQTMQVAKRPLVVENESQRPSLGDAEGTRMWPKSEGRLADAYSASVAFLVMGPVFIMVPCRWTKLAPTQLNMTISRSRTQACQVWARTNLLGDDPASITVRTCLEDLYLGLIFGAFETGDNPSLMDFGRIDNADGHKPDGDQCRSTRQVAANQSRPTVSMDR